MLSGAGRRMPVFPGMNAAIKLDHTSQGARFSWRALDEEYSSLESDVTNVQSDYAALVRSRMLPKYCLDFDVLFPAINWLKEPTADEFHAHSEAFWTSLILSLPTFDIYLLPGTLWELFDYSKRRLRTIRKLYDTQFGLSFMRAFEKYSLAHLGDSEHSEEIPHYTDALARFQSRTIDKEEYYILSILQQKAALLPPPFPPINRHIFYRSNQFLARGHRIDRTLNNRVDAHNLSLIYALNNAHKGDDGRYVLISNSRTMPELDGHLTQAFEWNVASRVAPYQALHNRHVSASGPKNVWSPRRAAIFQLLGLAAGNDIDQAVTYSWQLLASIRDAKAVIAQHIAAGEEEPRNPEGDALVASHNFFLDVISSIDAIQRQIDSARRVREHSISVLERKYDLRKPLDFLEYIDDKLRKSFLREGYEFIIAKEFPSVQTHLHKQELARPDGFTFERCVNIRAGSRTGDVLFTYYKYKDRYLFVSFGNMPTADLFDLASVLRQEISWKGIIYLTPHGTKDRFGA